MLFSRSNLAVRYIASKDPKDGALNCVHFAPDGATVASNGRSLLAVSPANSAEANFPYEGEQAEPFAEGVSVELDIIEDAVRNLPKDRRPSLQHVAMTQCDATQVELTTIDMRKTKRVSGAPIREEFPHWKTILRKAHASNRVGKICINRRELTSLLNAMDEACPDPGETPVFIEFGGETDGVILRAISYESGQHAVGFIMPLNTGGKWVQEDSWVDGVLGAVKRAIRRVVGK